MEIVRHLQAEGIADRYGAGLGRIAWREEAVEVEMGADVGPDVSGCRVLLCSGRQEVDTVVDTHDDFVVADAQAIAVLEHDGTRGQDGRVPVVHVHAVGAGVP
jgi:hypothetical protein